MGSNGNGNCPTKKNDRTKILIFKYKIKNKICLTFKNITTAIDNKKHDAKQAKYTIVENIKFHKFRLNTPPGIRNSFHVDKLRATSRDIL